MEARRVIICIAAVSALGFFVDRALPYLLLDPQVMARYAAERAWLLIHVASGSLALLIGPLQLWLGIHRRAMRLHRRLGMAYAASVAIGSCAAFYLASQTMGGWVFATGITGLGAAWIVTTAMAIVAIRRGLIEQHREWAIRSYVVTFAFVTFRVAWSVMEAAQIGTLREQLGAASFLCWAVPLLVTEVCLQWPRIRGLDARPVSEASR
jgi:uncharacterized membrane protein